MNVSDKTINLSIEEKEQYSNTTSLLQRRREENRKQINEHGDCH